ncbi:hypothetical protein [Pedobacter gandavensis]|uniref:hypothetical protein n=1 Tax=Pedobacter gandavensis TaxID=2679963 RepID=UPI002931718C|nr:hypothetical protein [Pedobacter gandavensis]
MNKLNILVKRYAFILLLPLAAGCNMFGMEMQKKYDYNPKTLDPNINISARQFLENRSYTSTTNLSDTVFKWMRKGLEYAEIDLAAYEKQGMTFIFLHNDAVRVWDAKAKKVTAGMWVDFPIITLKPGTNEILTSRPASRWEDYPKEDVRNYFLYLMLQGNYNFNNIRLTPVEAQTMLPPGTLATKASGLGLLNDFKGFDQEGKMSLRIINNDDLAPIEINKKTKNRSGGYVTTNAIVHVYGNTVYPFRVE